jgi:hypothetical protein
MNWQIRPWLHALPLVRPWDCSGALKPDWFLLLMAAMAPDFPYQKSLSSSKTLSFVQEGEDDWAWAIQFQKDTAAFEPRPKLVCLDRRTRPKPGTSLPQPAKVFQRVDAPIDLTPRGIECGLMYWLPRLRRCVAILTMPVRAALANARKGGGDSPCAVIPAAR